MPETLYNTAFDSHTKNRSICNLNLYNEVNLHRSFYNEVILQQGHFMLKQFFKPEFQSQSHHTRIIVIMERALKRLWSTTTTTWYNTLNIKCCDYVVKDSDSQTSTPVVATTDEDCTYLFTQSKEELHVEPPTWLN